MSGEVTGICHCSFLSLHFLGIIVGLAVYQKDMSVQSLSELLLEPQRAKGLEVIGGGSAVAACGNLDAVWS